MTVNRMTLLPALCAILALDLSRAGDLPKPLRIDEGRSHTATLPTPRPGEPHWLWLRARIVLDQGEQPGAHALKLSLNGRPLTPQTVQALNTKDVVFDGPRDTTKRVATSSWDAQPEMPADTRPPGADADFALDEAGNAEEAPPPDAPNPTADADWTVLSLPQSDLTSVPAFDEQSGAWYLKADSDDIAFNDADVASNYKAANPKEIEMPSADMMARAARRSHYYEYLLRIPGDQIKASNSLEFSVSLPERLKGRPVEISAVELRPFGDGIVFFARPWMEFVYPWQAPSLDDALSLEKGIAVTACAGEYEPVAFSLYTAAGEMDGLSIEVEPLANTEGASAIPPGQVSVYREANLVDQAGLHIPWNRGNLSPELLKPIGKDTLTLKPRQSQTFLLDIRVPDNQPPGTYRGAIVVRTARGVLQKLPLNLEVYPFKLAKARQKYWMWRLHWLAPWLPDSVACLRDIKEHGMDGLVQTKGTSFHVTFDKNGKATVDDTGYRKFVAVLEETGLSKRIADSPGAIVEAAMAHAGLTLEGGGEIADLKSYFMKVVEREKLKQEADAAMSAATVESRLSDSESDDLTLDEPVRTAKQQQLKKAQTSKQEIAAEAQRRAAEWYAKINPLAVEGFRKVKEAAEKLGLDYYVFPVDEPCGTPWRRRWVKYASTLAHEAGLKVWNTHNDILGWDSGIDVSCAGSGIGPAHTTLEIQRGIFEGGLAFPAIPHIGKGFDGLLDQVCVYNRPLSDDEMRRQREEPAAKGLIAHYAMDEGQGNMAVDHSGNHHDAKLAGGPGWEDGKIGKALRFSKDAGTRIETPAAPAPIEGWSISFWMKGRGSLFGRGEGRQTAIGCDGSQLSFATNSSQLQSFRFGTHNDSQFWTHVTLSLDNKTKEWKALFRNEEQRAWYRENVDWIYIQVRGRWNPWGRYQTGCMAWYEPYIGNITCFGYDWNWGSTHLAYPEGGHRSFKGPQTKWYGTLGWTAVREGIDDARYLHTLFLAQKEKLGGDESKAEEAVREALGPVDRLDWLKIQGVYTTFDGFDPMRRQIAAKIISLAK